MITQRRNFCWNAGSHKIMLGKRTCIMGIVNVTPDSFSGDGTINRDVRERTPGLRYALQQIDNGADILDIGGESSRPGATMISEAEEIARVVPLIKSIDKQRRIPVSIDTYKLEVARQSLDAGAVVVNLIKGTPPNTSLLKLIKQYRAGLVLMHMRGMPADMQSKANYKDLIREVSAELKTALDISKSCGLMKSSIVIDPGIGFAKTTKHNVTLLNKLETFQSLGYPILIGTSRKSFIGNLLNDVNSERLSGTIASSVLAIAEGAHILRVHDVEALKHASTIADAIVSVN